jgi:hypothetical protein
VADAAATTVTVPAGTWVELHDVVAPAGERAPQVPPETQQVPLELRVRGWLVADARLDGLAAVSTPAGRRVTGRLAAIQPGHTHSFGPSVPELLAVGRELRSLLGEAAP